MQLRLIDLTRDDLYLVEGWFRADHVKRFWGNPEANARLFRDPPPGMHTSIIEADGRKVGVIVWQHPPRLELVEAGLEDVPTSVVDIDIMIGEQDATGRGIGSETIRMVAEAALRDETVPYCIACTASQNASSIRAYTKAGFVQDRTYDDPIDGSCILMVRSRSRARVEE